MKKALYTEAHRQTARDIAAQTFVLLKNDNNLLPLKKSGSIALIGPLADNRANLPGCWSTADKPEKYATVKEAMQRYLDGKATVLYAQGSNIYDDSVRQEAVAFGRSIPRGNGLSYTTYKYSPVTLSASTMKKGGKITASATITNTGSRDGDEIVEFYIHDRYASIVRPVKELKGFQRIHLAKGESKTVSFDIDAATLSYYDADGNSVLEPGDFDIMIGPSSQTVNTAVLKVTE